MSEVKVSKQWIQFNCQRCEGVVSARTDSILGMLHICETCARKTKYELKAICAFCIHRKVCLSAIRTCLKFISGTGEEQ